MDSGNSGSVQSSSGGDEEYNSQADQQILHGNLVNNPRLSSFSDYLNLIPQSPIFNLPSNYNHSFPQSHLLTNPISVTANHHITRPTALLADSHSPASTHFIPPQSTNQLPPFQSSPPAHDSGTVQPAVRTSKKRTRASRRAPTTVLTTDTSNFRAMVQEFTGIPSPPFSTSSSYPRRLDLFSSGGSSGLKSCSSDSIGGLYPIRPSPQKVQLYSSTSSSMLHNNVMVNSINMANENFSSSSNYHKLQSNHSNMVTLQQDPDPIAPFQSCGVGFKSRGCNVDLVDEFDLSDMSLQVELNVTVPLDGSYGSSIRLG